MAEETQENAKKENKKTFGKDRGGYKIDFLKSPAENIMEAMKQVFPVETALNRMTRGEEFFDTTKSGIHVNEVHIYGADNYGNVPPGINFERIIARAVIPGRGGYTRASKRGYIRASKKWSLKLRNGTISLSWLKKAFDDLNLRYKEAEEKEKQRKIRQEHELKRLNEVREKSNIPQSVYLSKYDDKEMYSINLTYLSEEQVVELGPYLLKIIGSKKDDSE
jgi:hypothetical protein